MLGIFHVFYDLVEVSRNKRLPVTWLELAECKITIVKITYISVTKLLRTFPPVKHLLFEKDFF